ncbi:ribosome dissociation factor [Martiniozyma asiatica (nom. inval.)]|nr:ribosome dissociation factor [Martiniozyma asiatica]
MKLLTKEITNSGPITIVPQDGEDLYVLYHLLTPGSIITIKTQRNVKPTPTSKPVKKLLTLHLSLASVNDVEFTPADDSLRFKAITTEQHPDVPLHSHHTAEVTLNHSITISKDWSQHELDQINEACNLDAKAEMGAIVFDASEGVGHVCLITDNMTLLKNKVEKSIPKKRRGDSKAHDKAIDRFYELLINSAMKLDLKKLKVVLLVSPGNSDTLRALLVKEMEKEEYTDEEKGKFVMVKSANGYLHSLKEALMNPNVSKLIEDTKVQRGAKVYDEFLKCLSLDNGKAFYGEKEVLKAVEMGGGVIKFLLLSDALFKNDVGERDRWMAIKDTVELDGGEVLIISSLTGVGEELTNLTGVAVVLNWPVHDLDESEEEFLD